MAEAAPKSIGAAFYLAESGLLKLSVEIGAYVELWSHIYT